LDSQKLGVYRIYSDNLPRLDTASIPRLIGLYSVGWRWKVAISTKKRAWEIHPLDGLLRMGRKEWWKYFSHGTTLTPTNQVRVA